jgi:hypothetical protein
LVTTIKTLVDADKLGLTNASKSMYSESFGRYSPSIFRNILYKLLEKMDFLEIKEIKALGRFSCIDGSIFPAIKSMAWASYKSKINAIKLHLSFELNRMIPLQFMSTEANFPERKALLSMLEEGITFIADRGYICFELFHEICQKACHFIIRLKSNQVYDVCEYLSIDIPEKWACFFQNIKDLKIVFENDKYHKEYRLVSFTAIGQHFLLLTDRFDMKTYEIIMLYAYRWQIELIFRFLKRTLNCIHLMSHSPRGIEVQFTLFMITYLLLLYFKQQTESDKKLFEGYKNTNNLDVSEDPKNDKYHEYGFVFLIGKRLQKYWKIGIHWLTAIQNLMAEIFTIKILKTIRLIQ